MARLGRLYNALASCWLLGCWSGFCATQPASPQMPFSFVENRGQTDAQVRVIGNGPRFKAWFESTNVLLQQGDSAVRMEFAGARPQPVISLTDPIGATANYIHGADPSQWKTDLPMFRTVHYGELWPGISLDFRQDRSRVKAEYRVAPGADIDAIRLRFDGEVSIDGDGSLRVRNASGEFREETPVFFQEGASGRKIVRGHFVRAVDSSVGFGAEYDHSQPLLIDPPILFSGHFGGSAQDDITAVAVNSTYNVIVAGYTLSTDLPTSGGARVKNGGGVDAFVASFSPVGGQLVYCTYLGGVGDDRAFGVAVDAANNTYVTGWTSSGNFPIKGSIQSRLSGARDAFVTKLDPTGSTIIYSTYLGGSGVDVGNAIAVDSAGQAVIVGDTNSTNLPVTAGVFQRTLGGGQDAFLARLSPSGAALSFLTYFGGNSTEHSTSVQIDSSGPIVIAGSTFSYNLPVLQAYQARSGGGQDGFVAKFAATGTALVFSTYLGGSGGSPGMPEQVNGIIIGTTKNIVVAGTTSSLNFPVSPTSMQPVYGGGQTDGFLTKLNGQTGALLSSTFFGGSSNDSINALAADQNGRLFITGFSTSLDLPVKRPNQSASAGGVAGSMDAFVATVNSGMTAMSFGTYLGGSGSDAGNAITVDPMTSIIIAGQTGSFDYPVSGNLGNYMTEALSSFVTKLAPNWTLSLGSGSSVSVDVWHTGTISAAKQLTFGQPGDIHVVADWTGAGVKTIGVFRAGTWILDTNGNGVIDSGDKTVVFGQAGDIPIVGDWNGTGQIKLGLFRAGTFILDLSGHLSGIPTGLVDAVFPFGLLSDLPVTGDWNASGTTKVGVFRNGSWLVDYNGDRVFNVLDRTYAYGQTGDIPVTGDWDSSGLTRIGVYRNGFWILNYSGTNTLASLGVTELYIQFGAAGNEPLVW